MRDAAEGRIRPASPAAPACPPDVRGGAQRNAALDTKEVARTAVEMFSGEKLPARRSKKTYPRPQEMFNVDNVKDIHLDEDGPLKSN